MDKKLPEFEVALEHVGENAVARLIELQYAFRNALVEVEEEINSKTTDVEGVMPIANQNDLKNAVDKMHESIEKVINVAILRTTLRYIIR